MTEADSDYGMLVLGRYRVMRRLARGGMGIVYLGRVEGAAGFTRPVVIKRVAPHLADDDSVAELFAREARILANLQHPNIVNVIDFDRVKGGGYVMVLEYVSGYNLGQWHDYAKKTGAMFAVDHCVELMIQVLEALHYAHELTRSDGTPTPIIHRDVSPGNVLLTTQGQAKLVDFGIARMEGTGEYETRRTTFRGKLVYAAPELFNGDQPTRRTDIYACAVMLYHLITNVNPFRGKEKVETVRRVLTETPAPMSSIREDLPDGIDEVVAKAMARSPNDRHATAEEFAAALRALRTEPEEAIVESLGHRIETDFLGEMPSVLGLEPLDALEAAWRGPGGRADTPSEPAPPRGEHTTETIVKPSIDTQGGATLPEPATTAMPAPKKPVWWLAGLGVIALALGIGAWAFVRSSGSSPPTPSSRFVVIEKQIEKNAPNTLLQSSAAPGVPPALSATLAPSSEPIVASKDQPVGAGAVPKGQPAKASDPGGLTRAFQKQQGKVEACFGRHAEGVEGQPRISLRFELDAAGSVQNVRLDPGALQGTPLGQCILGVARSTRFPAQGEAVAFRIPITARQVK